MVRKSLLRVFLLFLLIGLFGCANVQMPNMLQANKILFSTYADDIGFTLNTPTKNAADVTTIVDLDGYVQSYAERDISHIWIVAEHENSDEPFNYYLNLEGGNFVGSLTLPYGEGVYDISIRAPGEKSGEQLTYYDVAQFSVNNIDNQIEQVVEYTRFGVEYNLDILNMEDKGGSVLITGNVDESYNDDKVLVEVRKEEDIEQIVWLINESQFSGEVPLYFGEGLHEIHIQLYNVEDEYYYTSGIIRVNNEVDEQFAIVETYSDYLTSGIILEQPTWSESYHLNDQVYTIKGKIDPELSEKGPIEHVIVTMTYVDEDTESGYIIPVENNTFADDVFFRFGPGEYEVKINIPDYEKSDQTMFYYKSIAKITHDVKDIPDERDLLPSRGIESEHPTIVAKAAEITANIDNDREKARTIYEYVAKNIAYDVKKAEADLFSVSDSALSTLHAGSGICQDYAFLTTALLRAVGLEAHYVSGHAGDRHAWVEVKIDDEWVEMDPTWGAGYVYNGEFYFQYNEDYFDPDPITFQQTHTRKEIMY